MFAYQIRAELNNDGSYLVELFDVGSDESPLITTIERASITISAPLDHLDTPNSVMFTIKGL